MKKTNKAFSMLEISVVLIIIGILVASIVGANSLIKASRLSNAKSLTAKSPVSQINGLVAWYETSLPDSLKTSESYDGAQISTWYDISPSSIVLKKNTLTKTTSNSLVYTQKGINDFPSLKFSGSGTGSSIDSTGQISLSSYYQGSSTNNTIFIVLRPTKLSGSYNKVFIDDSSTSSGSSFAAISAPNSSDGNTANQVYLNRGNAVSTATTSSAADFKNDQDYILAIYFNRANSKVYINSTNTIAGTTTLDAGSNYMNGLNIGSDRLGYNSFNGLISEVIVYDRPLKDLERKDVFRYLSNKYKISITESSNCSTGYSGSTCSDCSSGYVKYNGTCQANCSYSSQIGISDGAVSPGTGTLTCDATNFTGNLSYSCLNGIFSVTDRTNCTCSGNYSGTNCNQCATGYSGTNCGSCATGYTMVSGSCLKNCTVTGVDGITSGTTAIPPSGSLSCESPHLGTINYTCSSGVFAVSSGVCSPQCTGGTESTITVSGTSYKVHTFTSSGTLTCIGSGNIEVLVVAGGGAGGGGRGGGGGAGGVVYNSGYAISSSTVSVTVGAGGTGVTDSDGGNGANSVFGTITAIGGGGGGSGGGGSQCGRAGSSGGSGGGGGRTNSASGCSGPISGGSGTSGQGNSGGKSATNLYSGGGGGGASAAGSNGVQGVGGNGGNGTAYSITGSSVYYGGGGAAKDVDSGVSGTSGLGGGGAPSTAGTSNTGGGGGGGDSGKAGSNGGSGVVIVRYQN